MCDLKNSQDELSKVESDFQQLSQQMAQAPPRVPIGGA